MTDLIIGGRATGKSTELVKRSAATGVPILTATHNQRQYLLGLANKLRLTIPKPLIPDDVTDPTKFKGRRELALKGILIDNLNEVISVLCHCPVNAVSWTDYGNITHLPDKTVDVDGVKLEVYGTIKPTCRDMVKMQHPEMVGDEFTGGVATCPHSYGYLPKSRDLCLLEPDSIDTLDALCTRCWDQIAEVNGND